VPCYLLVGKTQHRQPHLPAAAAESASFGAVVSSKGFVGSGVWRRRRV